MANESTSSTVNVSVSIDRDVFEAIEELAENEHRSRSNMAEVLIREALAAREEARSAKVIK